LMVATAGFDDDQLTAEVRFCVEPSENLAVATNCSVSPLARLAIEGVTWIDTRVAALTIRLTLGEVIPLRVALMPVLPALPAEARPVEPTMLLIAATAGLEDDQP